MFSAVEISFIMSTYIVIHAFKNNICKFYVSTAFHFKMLLQKILTRSID